MFWHGCTAVKSYLLMSATKDTALRTVQYSPSIINRSVYSSLESSPFSLFSFWSFLGGTTGRHLETPTREHVWKNPTLRKLDWFFPKRVSKCLAAGVYRSISFRNLLVERFWNSVNLGRQLEELELFENWGLLMGAILFVFLWLAGACRDGCRKARCWWRESTDPWLKFQWFRGGMRWERWVHAGLSGTVRSVAG